MFKPDTSDKKFYRKWYYENVTKAKRAGCKYPERDMKDTLWIKRYAGNNIIHCRNLKTQVNMSEVADILLDYKFLNFVCYKGRNKIDFLLELCKYNNEIINHIERYL